MSDTKAAAEEASNRPAEVAKTEHSAPESVEAKTDEKNEDADTAAVAAKAETAANVTSEAGDPAEAGKSKDSSATNNGNEKKANGADKPHKTEKDKRSTDKKEDRYSRYDRSNKRKGPHNDRYKSKKSRPDEFAALPESDDPVEIRSQVEFYFSVQNLAQDKHMFFEIGGPENRAVLIKHIASFKRMRRFQPYSAVVAALRDSEQLVVLDEGEFSGVGNEGVQRKEPFAVPKKDSDEKRKPGLEELYNRVFRQSRNNLDASIYVKNFGREEDAGQIAIEQFFRPYGSVMVRKRRDEDEKWKGSVFVEFDNEESQQQFLALDPKPKFKGNELTVMSKKDYSVMKCKEKGITPAWDREPGAEIRGYNHGRSGRGGPGRGRGRGRQDRYSGRYDDRRDNRHRRDRDRSRSRSPYDDRRKRRDRSGSSSARDNKDWNSRRDKFQKSKEFHHDKRDKRPSGESSKRKNNESDREDSPKRNKVEKSAKRKADVDDLEAIPKKTKIEIKEDA